MMAFVVILEFGHSLFSVDEADVLLHRPISSRTFFFSKMINLIFYVLLMGTALGFFPALIGMILPDTPWFFCFVYFGVALMANFFMASMVVLLYSVLLRWLPLERLKDTLVHVQIGISFLLIFSYQFIPRIGELQADKLDISSLWIYLLPSAWFTGVIQFVLGTPHVMNGGVTVLALIGPFFLGGVAFRRSSSLYIQRVTAFSVADTNAGPKSG